MRRRQSAIGRNSGVDAEFCEALDARFLGVVEFGQGFLEIAALLATMNFTDLAGWTDDFASWAHEGQLEPAGDDWRNWLMLAGRGYGKTRAGAEWIRAQALGLDVDWVESDEVDRLNPALAPGQTMGASYAPGDGYIEPPLNVLAYTAAMFTSGVHVAERTRFTGLRTDGSGTVTGVQTSAGPIATERVVITGGPGLAAIGRDLGARIPSAAVRHQVVTTAAHPDLAADRLPMVFDVASGIYWRPDGEGGVLWGMSNPDEPPGESREFDWDYFETMRRRMAKLLPATEGLGLRRTWAASIDFTPDHLPILGPLLTDSGLVGGTTVAAAGGHGMMWGPGVARAAADLATTGSTDVVDATELGLDRFDEHGRSRLAADPIALPFPTA